MSAFPIAAAIAGGVNLLSGIGSYYSNKETNANNLKIAREQMAFNSEEAQKQRDWQAEQTRLQNEYNSPLNQKRRLMEAGINPYLVDVSTGTGSAASGGSAASAPSVASQRSFDFAPTGQGIADAILQASALNKTKAETDVIRQQGIGLEIENQFGYQRQQMGILESIGRLENQLSQARVNGKQYDLIEQNIKDLQQQYDWNKQTWESRKTSIEKQNQLLQGQYQTQLAEAAYKSAQKLAAEASVRLSKAQQASLYQGIRESVERISQIKASTGLTKQQEKVAIAEEAKKIAEKVGIEQNNKLYPKFSRKLESEIQKNYQQGIHILGTGIDYTNIEYYTHGGEWLGD